MREIKRRYMTLLEIMIVIFIIGIIGSVVGYNMKGGLDQGKAFKSEQGSRQIHDILTLAIAHGKSAKQVKENAALYLADSGLVKNAKKALQDGWGEDFVIRVLPGNDLVIYSKNWHNYLVDKKHLTEEELQEEYPWAFCFDGTDYTDEEPADKPKSKSKSKKS